jgi:DNA invertase Pin-like site-specific DNA recombinase
MNAGTAVLGYIRVSTAEQAGNGYGLDAQEAAIRDECDRRGGDCLK